MQKLIKDLNDLITSDLKSDEYLRGYVDSMLVVLRELMRVRKQQIKNK